MPVSAAEYMEELAAASRNYDGNAAQNYIQRYYGEFYDYDLDQSYSGKGQEGIGQPMSGGDTVKNLSLIPIGLYSCRESKYAAK